MANQFHQWLTQTRQEMMEATGTLEEQLEVLKGKAADIRANKTKLRKIEDLGSVLEKNLILDNRLVAHDLFSFNFLRLKVELKFLTNVPYDLNISQLLFTIPICFLSVVLMFLDYITRLEVCYAIF